MDVHLRDLRYFLAVAEELHFTRAAERLFVSQPALSRQIRHLEQQLRVPLFVRDRRRVELTAAGAALQAVARDLMAAWDAGQRQVGDAAAREAAVLRIGFATGLGRGLLPAVTDLLTERHPTWRLDVRQVPWTDPTGGLAEGEVDLAIVWLPVPGADRLGLRSVVLATEDLHVALPARHPLGDLAAVPLAELLDEPFVALPREAGEARDFWLASALRDGRPARVAAEAISADEAMEAVAAGLGVVLVAAGNAELHRRQGLVTRPVTGVPPAQLAAVWYADDARPVVRDAVEACLAV